jgi:hypothetical protein
MKTPLGIHAEKISSGAVSEVLKYWNKNKKFSSAGKSGDNQVNPFVKKSTDLSIHPSFFSKKLNKYFNDLVKVSFNYQMKYPEVKNDLNKWAIIEPVNIQLYKPGDGFYFPHYEREQHRYTRLLVFMTYLTDNLDGGTYFKYQDFYCPAIKGLTLIWPADFTFTHNGVTDFNNEKQIITGWFNYIINNK